MWELRIVYLSLLKILSLSSLHFYILKIISTWRSQQKQKHPLLKADQQKYFLQIKNRHNLERNTKHLCYGTYTIFPG